MRHQGRPILLSAPLLEGPGLTVICNSSGLFAAGKERPMGWTVLTSSGLALTATTCCLLAAGKSWWDSEHRSQGSSRVGKDTPNSALSPPHRG